MIYLIHTIISRGERGIESERELNIAMLTRPYNMQKLKYMKQLSKIYREED
jgi:hypothetical protein